VGNLFLSYNIIRFLIAIQTNAIGVSNGGIDRRTGGRSGRTCQTTAVESIECILLLPWTWFSSLRRRHRYRVSSKSKITLLRGVKRDEGKRYRQRRGFALQWPCGARRMTLLL
jgi:hypothetical protein